MLGRRPHWGAGGRIMKKIFICLLLCLMPFFIFAQESSERKYIDGYEDLEWGTTIEKVRSKYSTLSKEWDADCISGEECYSATSGSVQRIFRFYNNKLYWVRVVYDNITQSQFDALTDKLISKYGSLYFDIDTDEETKFGYEWLLFTDLVVTLSVNNKINGFGAKLGEWVGVTYYSKSIMKEMQAVEFENIEL